MGSFLAPPACTINPLRLYKHFSASPHTGHGILTVFPSATAFALTLGADSPYADEHCVGTLGLSATGSFTLFVVTHVSILTSHISRISHEYPFSDLENAPLPLVGLSHKPIASVYHFSPVTFSAQDDLSRPVSYYAFFKGWLLLSQPPGCLGLPTSFPT